MDLGLHGAVLTHFQRCECEIDRGVSIGSKGPARAAAFWRESGEVHRHSIRASVSVI